MNSKRTRQGLLAVVLSAIGVCCLSRAATTNGKHTTPNNDSQNTSKARDQEGSKGIESKETQKGIESKEVVDRGPKPAAAAGAPVTKHRRHVTYRSSRPFSKRPPAAGTENVKVGLTIWRVQANGSKSLDQAGEESHTLEQVEANTPLSIGSNVRLGIESLTHDGYLYVIDREQFADGTYGRAQLIFPTLRTRNGNNSISVNDRILIPRRPSYFRINPSSTSKQQVAEVLTIIISPAKLQLPTALGDKPMTLSVEQFNEWEGKWSAPVDQWEIEGGAGEKTGAKDLGQVGEESQRLNEGDPLPQTVYRVTIRRGNPLLVTVPLRFAVAPAAKQSPTVGVRTDSAK